MGTYRKEWPCCDSVSETEAYEPETCPFCRTPIGYVTTGIKWENLTVPVKVTISIDQRGDFKIPIYL